MTTPPWIHAVALGALILGSNSGCRKSASQGKAELKEPEAAQPNAETPEAINDQRDCSRWKGGSSLAPKESVGTAKPSKAGPPVRGFVDFKSSEVGISILEELQVELDALSPEFATCGLRLSDLRSLHFVISKEGVMQGRIVGLPPLDSLQQCPLVPNAIAMAASRGWLVESGDNDSMRIRRMNAEVLPDSLFAFATPKDQWLGATASAGPATRRVTVELKSDPVHELLLEISAPSDLIDSVSTWCQRFLQHQDSIGTTLLGSCPRTNSKAIQLVPAEAEQDDAIALALSVRTHLFETFNIHGESMLPGIKDGDIVFVDKLVGGQLPSRGAVVVFDAPNGSKLIKRVVGLPGERLTISPTSIQIDDKLIASEPAVDAKAAAQCGVELSTQQLGDERFDYIQGSASSSKAIEIPAGHIFVLGDNRSISLDSRKLGPIAVDDVDGIATFITWSSAGGTIDWERITQSLANENPTLAQPISVPGRAD